MHRRLLVLVGCSLFAACGCGGSGSGGSAPSGPSGQVRMFNDFVDVSKVTGKVGTTQFIKAQPFATISLYRLVPVGSPTATFTNSDTSAQLASSSITVEDQKQYTVIGVGSSGVGRHVMFLTDGTTVPSGQAAIRFLNGDEDAPSVDIYLTSTSTTSLTGVVPQESAVAYLATGTTYHTFAPGTYTVWYTAAGHPETVIVENNVTLTAGEEETLFAVKSGSGPIIQEIPE